MSSADSPPASTDASSDPYSSRPDAPAADAPPKADASSSTDEAIYRRGDALQDVLQEDRSGSSSAAKAAKTVKAAKKKGKAKAEGPTTEVGLRLGDVVENPAAWDLDTEEYWAWIAHLLRAGRRLDTKLDDLLHETYQCGTAFYKIGSWRRLRRILDDLYRLQPQLRDLEQDVKELSLVLVADPGTPLENATGDAASHLVLDNAKQTYDRVYQLCHTKRDRIQQGWVTATNLLISVIMLIVTILFWMEFR
jgi:hypothetical protein